VIRKYSRLRAARSPLYLWRPDPRRVASFDGVSLEELDFELSFELSLDEESFDELSDLGLSSDLSLDPESLLLEDPADEPFLA